MSQSLSNILVHIIFSTKLSKPFIAQAIKKELYSYMASILKDCDCSPIIIGGIEDHVHVLCKLSKTRSMSSVIEDVKKKSSKWIKTRGVEYKNFYWQNGYGAFSIGKSQVNTLRKYIQNQEEHHQKKSFKEEFLEILNRYGVEYDERYLWD
ncbi:MAG: IS200/IS605 family transposase [Candidatus Scalindua sp.]